MRRRHGRERGFTLIDLLAGVFIFGGGLEVKDAVSRKYGLPIGIAAGIVAGLFSFLLVREFYRWKWRGDRRRLTLLREQYRTIYRVVQLPSEQSPTVISKDADIRIGDFGWEAGPLKKDGLIYLQGLTPEWAVVWHAGFRPEQIEKIAAKSCSQYDHWLPDWANRKEPLPPCPYTILERLTTDMRLPHPSNLYCSAGEVFRVRPYGEQRPKARSTIQ